MSEDFITVSAGAMAEIDPGTYVVTLTEISEPREILAQKGPNAGQTVTLRDWTFALEDGTEIRGSTSTASGPKSKAFAWLTALLDGTPPSVGQVVQFSQLIGREVLATIANDDGGWPRIVTLSAKPKPRAAAPGAAPQPPTPATARKVAPVAMGAAETELPF